MPSRSTSCSVRPPGCGLVTSTSSTSRSVRSLANASSRVAMPFIGASALAMARMRPGTRGCVGGTKPSSTPSRMTCIRAGSTPKSVAMSRREASDGVRILRACRATLPCIRRKPYQRRSDELAAKARGRLEVDAAVEGDRVVHRGDHRQPELLDVEHAVAEHLVVVDDVEVVDPVARAAVPPAERTSWAPGSRAVHMVRNSSTSIRSRNSRGLGHPEGVGLAVEVQAGDLRQPDAGIELGVGLPGEHLDLVAEVRQLTAQVADVDALAPAMGLAPVGQQCDTQRRDLSLAPSDLWPDAPGRGMTRRGGRSETCSYYVSPVDSLDAMSTASSGDCFVLSCRLHHMTARTTEDP